MQNVMLSGESLRMTPVYKLFYLTSTMVGEGRVRALKEHKSENGGKVLGRCDRAIMENNPCSAKPLFDGTYSPP